MEDLEMGKLSWIIWQVSNCRREAEVIHTEKRLCDQRQGLEQCSHKPSNAGTN
jgi:hypothetical protein